jgi:hypothetical protein
LKKEQEALRRQWQPFPTSEGLARIIHL